nr:hypothetical protein [Tanacetum cinerariifolium]
MKRFEEAVYEKREEINERITEMFSLLKEYIKGKSSEKVLVREEVSKPITKYANAISLVRKENDNDKGYIKEDDYMPLILRRPFLTTGRAEIKYDKGSMTLRVGKFKVRFIRTLRFPSKVKERIKRDLDPMIPTNYVNRIILE